MKAVAVIALAGALSLSSATEARALQKVSRIGVLFSASPVSEMVRPEPCHSLLRAFLDRLRELGYVFVWSINRKTAKALGVPESVLPLADELIE